jgi:hypothetical protein
VSYLWATLRGLADAGGFSLGWFQGYEEPLNSLRAAKSFFLVLLLLPALRSQTADRDRHWRGNALWPGWRVAWAWWSGRRLGT